MSLFVVVFQQFELFPHLKKSAFFLTEIFTKIQEALVFKIFVKRIAKAFKSFESWSSVSNCSSGTQGCYQAWTCKNFWNVVGQPAFKANWRPVNPCMVLFELHNRLLANIFRNDLSCELKTETHDFAATCRLARKVVFRVTKTLTNLEYWGRRLILTRLWNEWTKSGLEELEPFIGQKVACVVLHVLVETTIKSDRLGHSGYQLRCQYVLVPVWFRKASRNAHFGNCMVVQDKHTSHVLIFQKSISSCHTVIGSQ